MLKMIGGNGLAFLSQVLCLVGFAFLFLIFYSLAKHKNRLSAIFTVMCIFSSIYVFGYSLELRAENLEQIKFYLKLEYFGFSFIPIFWFMLAYKFYYNKYPSFKLNIVVFIIPMLTLFLSATNDYHNLYYANITAVAYEGYIIAQITKGPWYYVFVFYSYMMLIYGIVVFYLSWSKNLFSMASQAFWMLLGSISLGVINIAYLIGMSPKGIDLTPFGFLVVAITYFIALFRYDFLEMEEIIRSIVFSEINEGILVIDDRKRLVDFNRAGQKLFSWLNTSNIGESIYAFEEGKKIMANHGDDYELEVIREEQKEYFRFHVTAIRETGSILGHVYIFQNITKQRDMLIKLNEMAYNDSLTGIYNRRRFLEEAEKELLRSKRFARYISLLMIDIDHFKEINDQHGHLAGDEVIVAIVQECKNRIRATDIIARLGGEEFAIVLVDTDSEKAVIVADDIRRRIADLDMNIYGKSIKVTISIGITTFHYEDNELTLEKLIDNADRALYFAKNSGRNKVVMSNK